LVSFLLLGSNLAVTGANIQVPEPIYVKPGGDITIRFALNVARDVSSNLMINIRIKKKILFWIPIPCIKNVGSCRYKITPDVLKVIGAPTQLKKGSYPVTTKIKIPGNARIPSFIANGRYYVEADLYDNGRPVGCLKAEATVRS